MPRLRVFLVDDHAIVREGLRALLGGQPGMEVVGEAEDGLLACDLIPAARPDVVVMDVSLPGMNGSQVTARVRHLCPTARVLALTVHEDKGYMHQLLAAGASGYVLKRAAADELIRAVQVVAAGGVYLDPTMAGKLVGGVVRRQGGDAAAVAAAALSDREAEVVRLTAAGYSNKEIAARLDVSVKTVETYRARAMEKLDLHGRTDIVRYAVHRGWLQEV